MPRLLITVSKKTDEVLKHYSEETSAPVAALIRQAIEEWAQKRGIDLDTDITWGGVRKPKTTDDDSQGQQVAVA